MPAGRDLVGESVLERVLKVREQARLIQELRGLQAGEAGAQRVLGDLRDRVQQGIRDVLANDGGGLE
jgi:hypothetical protein